MAKTTFSFSIERKGFLDGLAHGLAEGLGFVAAGLAQALAERLTPAPTPPPEQAPDPATREQERARRFQERRLDAFLDRAFSEFIRFIWDMNQRVSAAANSAPPDAKSPEPRPSPAAPAESAPNPP